MSIQQQQYIQTLVEKSEKLSLCDFFKTIHQKFYSNQDISFMEYFLDLTAYEGEFVVHHEKLIEYGIVTSNRSSDIKEKLDSLTLVENEDYQLQDILQLRPQGGTSLKNIYMLTPEAFKKCLMRAQRLKQKFHKICFMKTSHFLIFIFKNYLHENHYVF